jgi:hypothetical protein
VLSDYTFKWLKRESGLLFNSQNVLSVFSQNAVKEYKAAPQKDTCIDAIETFEKNLEQNATFFVEERANSD